VACGKRFTTYDRWERPELRVVKRDDRVEDFDRDKLELGVLKACEKRPIDREALGAMIDRIEEELRSREAGEVATTEIGAMVLEGLKALDQVAYLRFASVYKDFTEPEHFAKELKHLRQETLAMEPPGRQAKDERVVDRGTRKD
jgi:transcriptional repressor NrdR